MIADLPHTLYKSTKGGRPRQEDVDDAERRMREAYAKKKKRENEEMSIEEVFSAASAESKKE